MEGLINAKQSTITLFDQNETHVAVNTTELLKTQQIQMSPPTPAVHLFTYEILSRWALTFSEYVCLRLKNKAINENLYRKRHMVSSVF